MKNLHRLLAAASAAFFIACSPVSAQWQVPSGEIPVGRGAGTGFTSVQTGTSGHKIPFLDGANTWSAAQTFSGFISGQLTNVNGYLGNSYNSNGTYPPNNNGTGSGPGFALGENFSSSQSEVDLWNTVTSGGDRGFTFYQKTGTSSANILGRLTSTGLSLAGISTPSYALDIGALSTLRDIPTASSSGFLSTGMALNVFGGNPSGLPVVNLAPTALITRTESQVTGDSSTSLSAALLVLATGTHQSTGGAESAQTNGISVIAGKDSTSTGNVAGTISAAFTNGTLGTAFGLYGNAATYTAGTTTAAIGLELDVTNGSGNDRPWNPTPGVGWPVIGIDINYGGTASGSAQVNGGAGIGIRSAGSSMQWEVGLALQPSSIKTADIQSDSSAVNILLANAGAHTNGINLTGATYSSYALKATGFTVDGTGSFTATSATTNHITSTNFQPLSIAATGDSTLPLLTAGNSLGAAWAYANSGTIKWYIGKDPSDNFYVYDNSLSKNLLVGATGAGTLALGVSGTNATKLLFPGSTSGTVTFQTQAAAGTYNFNIPITAGSAGQVLTSQGGGSTAMTWTTPATGTVTSIATTSPITGGTITSTGTIACTTCVTSAASLTSNALMIGGGSQASATTTTGTGVLTALGINVGSAGAFVTNGGALGSPSSVGTMPSFTLSGTISGGAHTGITGLGIRDTSAAFDVTVAAVSSTTLTAGRTLTLDVGNVAHTLKFGTTANTITFPNLASYTVITNGDTATVTNAMHSTMATNTVKGNATSGSASPTDLSMPSCSAAASALTWTTNTGFGCNTITGNVTVGSSTITSGTTTRILYDNAGTLGEYTISGTGTTVPMTAGPTFTGTAAFASLTATGSATAPHIIGSGSAPTVGSCTGLGSTGSCSVVAGSTDLAGRILLTVAGTAPASTGDVVLTFASAYGSNALCTFMPFDNTGVWASQPTAYGRVQNGGTSVTARWINGASTALSAGSAYVVVYNCIAV